ncbi:MAG: ABC transporter substrate-binding protein, partial [Candidatus Atribacteria bacterium]|nr:ABC transporter substrate-binding protein [Candidatus Atribacteria bacterium]
MFNQNIKEERIIMKKCILILTLSVILVIGISFVALGYQEAPQLAELVQAGKLPPVEERLPEEPLIVKPVEGIGKYGGTWRRGFTGIKDYHAFGRQVYDPILRWPRDPRDPVQPGLAKEWEWADGGKTLTLHLREGLKWSDGYPFTTKDITFWW